MTLFLQTLSWEKKREGVEAKKNFRSRDNGILCLYLFYKYGSDMNMGSKSLSPALIYPLSSESYIHMNTWCILKLLQVLQIQCSIFYSKPCHPSINKTRSLYLILLQINCYLLFSLNNIHILFSIPGIVADSLPTRLHPPPCIRETFLKWDFKSVIFLPDTLMATHTIKTLWKNSSLWHSFMA